MLRFRRVPCAFVVCALAVLSQAQGNPCVRRTVVVSVVDKQGDSVDRLTAADFQGEAKGKPLRILAASQRVDVRFFILLDVSGSMLSPRKWELARSAALNAASSIEPGRPVMLGLFSTRLLETTNGRDAVLSYLEKLSSAPPNLPEKEHMTALLGSIDEALDQAALGPGDVVWIISDGGENEGLSKNRSVLARLSQRGVRVYALVANVGLYTEEEISGLEWLIRFARASGGNAAIFLSQAHVQSLGAEQYHSVAQANRDLLKQMTPFYELTIGLQNEIDKPARLKLSFTKASDRKLTLLYPEQIAPCRP